MTNVSLSIIVSQETIAKDSVWIGNGRKEVEDYLLKLSEANRHAFKQRVIPLSPVSVAPAEDFGPKASKNVELISTSSRAIIDPVSHQVDSPSRKKDPEQLLCSGGDLVSYWQKTTERDEHFVSPFANIPTNPISKTNLREKYITFEPDVGGWNNIRMQMEVVIVFAAATGRTLVMPPEQAMVITYIIIHFICYN